MSLWADLGAVHALATSPSDRDTVQALQATGLLQGEQIVDVFDVRGGAVQAETLGAML